MKQHTLSDFLARLNDRYRLQEPFTVRNLVDNLGVPINSVKYFIKRLKRAGVIVRLEHGIYSLGQRLTLTSRKGVNQSRAYRLQEDHEHQQWLAAVQHQQQQRLERYRIAQTQP